MSNRSRTLFFVLLAVLAGTALVYLLRHRVAAALATRPDFQQRPFPSSLTNNVSIPATMGSAFYRMIYP